MIDLPLIFAALAIVGVAIYVMADGFDLGVGALFLFGPREKDRDVMVESIEPVWDGNETWLVMGGTLLLAAFPAAYYVLLPAFYLPLMLMLLALIFRGVAFTFRYQAANSRRVWDYAFAGGSIVATFAQGLVLGGFVGGVDVVDGTYAGGPFEAFSWLGALCGLGLLAGYALRGAGWLIWRTQAPTQVFAREIGHAAVLGVAAMMLIVSAWTALDQPEVAHRWFSWPNIAWLAPVPIATALLLVWIWRSLWSQRDARVFWLAIGVFLLGFLGLGVSLWPYVVPRSVTVWGGAGDPQTLLFIDVGIAIVLPIVIARQLHAYWIFRGKIAVRAE